VLLNNIKATNSSVTNINSRSAQIVTRYKHIKTFCDQHPLTDTNHV